MLCGTCCEGKCLRTRSRSRFAGRRWCAEPDQGECFPGGRRRSCILADLQLDIKVKRFLCVAALVTPALPLGVHAAWSSLSLNLGYLGIERFERLRA